MAINIVKFIEKYRFFSALIFLAFMWGTLAIIIFNYGDELQKHPCSVCANKMGDTYICMQKLSFGTIEFEGNGTVNQPNRNTNYWLNASGFKPIRTITGISEDEVLVLQNVTG